MPLPNQLQFLNGVINILYYVMYWRLWFVGSSWNLLEIFHLLHALIDTEAAVHRCSVKMVFLEICKIHRKTPVTESLF